MTMIMLWNLNLTVMLLLSGL